jgi:alkylated DNA repair dioxygenase AlkB
MSDPNISRFLPGASSEKDLPVRYTPDFVPDAQAAFDELWAELGWERRDKTPRREYYANDVAVPYTYGQGAGVRTYEAKPRHPRMKAIQAQVEALTGARLEACFLNGYENSRDQLGWHADDSPEMNDALPIAIVTLGAERDIWFCPQGDRKAVTGLKLQSGSLCLMLPGMQDTHFHRIPKADRDVGPRISLTFRGYVDLLGAGK